MDTPQRSLTDGELRVLALVQDLYGDLNQPSDVVFTGAEAILFVRDARGTTGLLVNLALLSDLLASGETVESIRRDWLTPHAAR